MQLKAFRLLCACSLHFSRRRPSENSAFLLIFPKKQQEASPYSWYLCLSKTRCRQTKGNRPRLFYYSRHWEKFAKPILPEGNKTMLRLFQNMDCSCMSFKKIISMHADTNFPKSQPSELGADTIRKFDNKHFSCWLVNCSCVLFVLEG